MAPKRDPASPKRQTERTVSNEISSAKSSDSVQTTFAQLDPHQRIRALDAFAVALEEFFQGTGPDTRERVMARTGESIGKTFDVRQYDAFQAGLYEADVLKLAPRQVRKYESRIREQFHFPNVSVVGGEDTKRFGRVGAEVLLKQVMEIGRNIKQQGKTGSAKDSVLSLGIVSGSTTPNVVNTLNESMPNFICMLRQFNTLYFLFAA